MINRVAVAKQWATEILTERGIPNAALDVRVLLAAVLQKDPAWLFAYPEACLSPEQWQHFQQMVERRQDHEPVARIVGQREFWGLPFQVTPDVLDPRADSESLVHAALAHWPSSPTPRLLDLGTGSGCLLLSLLYTQPTAYGVGVDQSAGAINTAQHNALALAHSHDASLEQRCKFIVGDWTTPDFATTITHGGMFEMVISNPPYIPTEMIKQLTPDVQAYDPWKALDGGHDGLAAYQQLALVLPKLVVPGGTILVEIGHGQFSFVQEIFEKTGLTYQQVYHDLQAIPRALVFQARNV